jgi:hypothetical protein
MAKMLYALAAVMLLVTMASAGSFVVPIDNSSVKVYYVSEPLRELYSYKVVELTNNMTDAQFQDAFDNASPVFAGDINPDIRNSFPLRIYNLATDIYGNSP